MEDGEKHTEMEKGGRNLFITRTKKICPIIREREKRKKEKCRNAKTCERTTKWNRYVAMKTETIK